MQPLTDTGNSFPEWARNLTLYEVNLRQYTPEGSIRAFRAHLPRLKELGVGIFWFMPVQPVGLKNRKGSLGSYYSIRDYCAVDAAFGTIGEFRELVDEIHSMGMYVLLDWVANHTAWDHHWVTGHPDYYRRNEAGEVFPPFPDWADVVGLDYSKPELRSAMIGCMKFWLSTAGIDGFRCDMAHLVVTDFWEEARAELQSLKPEIYMLAETDHYDLLEKAFHSSYDWRVFHAINEVAQGKITVQELSGTIQEQLEWYPPQASLMRFISNHDENSWQGSEIERLTFSLEAMTVLYFTLPGIPLIYSGQESGNYRRLSFFDKDCIDWKEDKMRGLFTRLAGLRSSNPALWSAGGGSGYRSLNSDSPEKVLSFLRSGGNNQVLVLLNLGYETVKFTLKQDFSPDPWTDLFNPGMKVIIAENPCFELPAWGYRVFYRPAGIFSGS